MDPSQTKTNGESDVCSLAYVSRDVDRHGRVRYYLRMPGRPRERIREEFGTPAFERAYWRARKGLIDRKPKRRDPAPMREPGKARSGEIYFIEAIGTIYVKIGFSHDADLRMADLQVASPHQLRMLFRIGNADENLERALHLHFDHLRIRGEWFRAARELNDFMRETSAEGYQAIIRHGIKWRKPEAL